MFSHLWNRLTDEERSKILSVQSEIPVKLGDLASSLGLVVKAGTLRAGISGEIRKSSESTAGFIIRVNRHENKTRQRFTLAHEIAHYLLHRDKIGDGIEDDLLYRSPLSSNLEVEANYLAADILMPWKIISELWLKYNTLDREQRIQKIADELGVSNTAMEIRLDSFKK